jgi:uncharacterized membrane protein SirB2
MMIKHLHLTIIVLTFVFFLVNLVLTMKSSQMVNNKFLKITPHILYTLFVITFLYLTYMIELYPFVNGWASSKLAGFVFYILSITLALKWAKNNMWRIAGLISAVFWLAMTARLGFADRLKVKNVSEDPSAYLYMIGDAVRAFS